MSPLQRLHQSSPPDDPTYPDDYPVRSCIGHPTRTGWCGKPAVFVGANDHGEFFCCEEHAELADQSTPIREWFDAARVLWLAEDAAERLVDYAESY